MLQFILKYKSYLIGIALGALAGFLYWRFIGCSSGTCPLTSKWYNSTLFGAVAGYLVGSPTRKTTRKEAEKSEI